MNTKQIILISLVLLAAAVANAAGGAGHGLDEHMKKTIMWQTLNVSVMLLGLAYILRNPVRDYFSEKTQTFRAAAEKAEEAKKKAEAAHADIQVRLTKLNATADESVSRARAEAADLKKQILSEAEAVSKRIKEEAEAAARLEVEKSKREIRELMIAEATQMAQAALQEKLSSEDHHRLQGEFINNIQAVR